MGYFDDISRAPPDPILGLTAAFNSDPRPHKVNLSVGLYKTEALLTPIMSPVKKAEKNILDRETTKEYLPIDGDVEFLQRVGPLVFGEDFWMSNKQRCFAAQTVGGTGALRIGGDFLKHYVEGHLFVSDPTWPNHKGVFTRCGMTVESYPYYDAKEHKLDFTRWCHFLEKLPPRRVVVLHACCHNPTGADPTMQEWEILCDLMKKRQLIPFFDSAYQGLGNGLDEDAQVLRLFAKKISEMVVACSFSKNFGLYAERVGALFILAQSNEAALAIGSKIKEIIRTSYSNPPLHGARIIAEILSTKSLRQDWQKELHEMRMRIVEMRKALTFALIKGGSSIDFRYLEKRSGMFCFTGLSKHQVDHLIADFGIYLTPDGRINVLGINRDNLSHVVNAILNVIKRTS